MYVVKVTFTLQKPLHTVFSMQLYPLEAFLIFLVHKIYCLFVSVKVRVIQRYWRGTRVRLYVKRVMAVNAIMLTYRNYRMRSWMLEVVNTFKDVKKDPELGRWFRWPSTPRVLLVSQ